ncbi:hypothetical protein HHI36_014154 [Cryptolaemus montrouzieri]|uniref:Uncharacterized protein n=1 Tax=Cryptolaemus montrouzieri TaxID=559131 RepID=A0ABD2N2Q4_9CUCU
MTIYNIPALVRDALSIALTPTRMESSNTTIFTDDDFISVALTGRPFQALTPEIAVQPICTRNSKSLDNEEFPRQPRRPRNIKRQRKGTSVVLTDTPKKDALEPEQNNTKSKILKKEEQKKLKCAKRKVLKEESGSCDEDEYFCLVCTVAYIHTYV